MEYSLLLVGQISENFKMSVANRPFNFTKREKGYSDELRFPSFPLY